MDVPFSINIKPAAGLVRRHNRWIVAGSMVLAIAAWHLLSLSPSLGSYILPGPLKVGHRFVQALSDGTLLRHTCCHAAGGAAGAAGRQPGGHRCWVT